jgi:hypothetical protein
MLYYAWSLHTCIHMSKMIYCIMKTSIAHSFMERHIFPTCSPVVYPWFYADSRNRPCHGILHLALRPYHRFHSKFFWRDDYCSCSEVSGCKVSHNLTAYSLAPGSTLCWCVEWQMPLQVRKETAIHFGWMHIDMCRCELYHVPYVFEFPLFFTCSNR